MWKWVQKSINYAFGSFFSHTNKNKRDDYFVGPIHIVSISTTQQSIYGYRLCYEL